MFMFGRERRLQNREAQKKSSCATICSKVSIILSVVIFLFFLSGGWGLKNVALAGDIIIHNVSVSEDQSTVNFTITHWPAESSEVSVNWSTGDPSSGVAATAGSDYTAGSGTVNFAAGETAKTISVAIIDDTIVEASEKFLAILDAGSISG
ncbi:MAG: hypothetical protein LJE63_01860, partial [Desulfobacteraceae bacterium]|nr:hypothetical protein [Desulfobacteraceae bacterium]